MECVYYTPLKAFFYISSQISFPFIRHHYAVMAFAFCCCLIVANAHCFVVVFFLPYFDPHSKHSKHKKKRKMNKETLVARKWVWRLINLKWISRSFSQFPMVSFSSGWETLWVKQKVVILKWPLCAWACLYVHRLKNLFVSVWWWLNEKHENGIF